MSKIGKKTIEIVKDTNVKYENREIVVKGPLGELKYQIPTELSIEMDDKFINVKPVSTNSQTPALWGLWRSIIANAVIGVSKGYERQLELSGVGYRVQPKGNGVELEVGYSHKVNYDAPEGIKISVEKGVISIKGIDKQLVGQVTAKIRAIRKPEPYKGKGIRYLGEVIKLKPGKAAKTGASA